MRFTDFGVEVIRTCFAILLIASVPIHAETSHVTEAQTPLSASCPVFPADNIWNTSIDRKYRERLRRELRGRYQPLHGASPAIWDGSREWASSPRRREFLRVEGFAAVGQRISTRGRDIPSMKWK